MLTRNDSSNNGNKKDFHNAKSHNLPGTKNERLMKCLEKYKNLNADEKDISCIEFYFNSEGYNISISTGNIMP